MLRYLKALFFAIIGRAHAKPVYDKPYEFIFGEAASKKIEHGVIIGTWPRDGYGQREISIGFNVEGHDHPPEFTYEFFEQLKEKAKQQGIVLKRLYAYGGLMRARYDYSQVERDIAEAATAATAQAVPQPA
jgi:hypothetical protein